MAGMRCRACRRYVFSWVHITLLVIVGIVVVIGLLEVFFRLT